MEGQGIFPQEVILEPCFEGRGDVWQAGEGRAVLVQCEGLPFSHLIGWRLKMLTNSFVCFCPLSHKYDAGS